MSEDRTPYTLSDHSCQGPHLENVLPSEQAKQLVRLIAHRLFVGWGSVEIVIKDGHIVEFREVATTPAINPKKSLIAPSPE